MSQTQIADHLGLTFQQVQKYEKGVNRVGAGRLNQIADMLGVPVSYFYEGAPHPGAHAKVSGSSFGVEHIAAFLATKQGLLLGNAFLQIKNEDVRRRLLSLMITLAGSSAGKILRSRVGPKERNNAGPSPSE